MISMILIIFIAAIILKLVFMASLETLFMIIMASIGITIAWWLFAMIDKITFKGWAKIATWGSVFYGLSWCWQALPA